MWPIINHNIFTENPVTIGFRIEIIKKRDQKQLSSLNHFSIDSGFEEVLF